MMCLTKVLLKKSIILSRSNFRGVRHPQMPNGAASEDAGSSILDLLMLRTSKFINQRKRKDKQDV